MSATRSAAASRASSSSRISCSSSVTLHLLARRWFRQSAGGDRTLPALALLAGVVSFVATCALYARVNGRSAWWALLGLLNCIGYFIILSIKKHCHRCGRENSRDAPACIECDAPSDGAVAPVPRRAMLASTWALRGAAERCLSSQGSWR